MRGPKFCDLRSLLPYGALAADSTIDQWAHAENRVRLPQ